MSTKVKLQQINSIFKELQAQIALLNKAKSSLQKKEKTNSLSIPKKDKKKILTLFQHSTWEQFMKWVNQKLVESGQNELAEQIGSGSSLKNLQNTQHESKTSEQMIDFQLTGELKVEENQKDYVESQKRRVGNILNREVERKQQQELELLALENGRLRRENIILKNKLIQIRSSLPE